MSQRLQVFESNQIRVTFDPQVCRHSGNCVRGLPAVFDLSRRNWVDPTKAAAQDIMETVAKCPSGALRATLVTSVHSAITNDLPPVSTPVVPDVDRVRITVRPNASLLIEGPFKVVDPEGNILREGEKCSLCRCGLSKNKPFCDSSHREACWRSN